MEHMDGINGLKNVTSQFDEKSYRILSYCLNSARDYYRYLQRTGKGISEIKIKEFEITDERIILYLDQKTNGSYLENAEYDFRGRKCCAEDLKILDYNPNWSILTLAPPPAFRLLFEQTDVSDITIITDMKFLVKRVGDFFVNALKCQNEIHIPEVRQNFELTNGEQCTERLSDEQYDAVSTILSEPCSYIWGAPGTGKTRMVLARAIWERIKNGQVIAIFAATNNALDQSLFGIIEFLEEHGIDIDSTILRLGIPTEKLAQKYPKICEKRTIEQELKEAEKRLLAVSEYIDETISCGELYLKMCEAQDIRDRLIYAAELVQKEWEEMKSHDEKIASLRSTLSTLQSGIDIQSELQHKLKRDTFSFKHFVRKFVSKEYREDFDSQVAKCAELLDKYQKEYKAAAAELDAEQLTISDVKKRLCGCEGYNAQVKRFNELIDGQLNHLIEDPTTPNAMLEHAKSFADFTASLYEKASKALLDNLDFAGKDLFELQKIKLRCESEYKRIKKDSAYVRIKHIQVLAATVDTMFVKYDLISGANIVHAFLDEAAYCPLIKSAPLFMLNCPVSMLGDHMQLPPVCEANENDFKIEENRRILIWSQPAIFIENLFCDNELGAELYVKYMERTRPSMTKIKMVTLNETYRFGPSLSSILADNVYSELFHSAACTAETKLSYIDAKKQYCPGVPKRVNISEAKAIAQYITAVKPDPDSICIISPYRNQVTALKKHLPKNYRNIYTVHKSQGQEFETVLLSVVDANNIFFADSQNKDSRGLECLVTAVSRAKEHLVLVLDYDIWRVREEQFLGKLLSICAPLDINAGRIQR